MKISVIRHGQTTGNISKIVESGIGGKLTEMGITQAQAAAEKLKAEVFESIYCSDMQRCIETASYIRQYHSDTPFFLRNDIRELSKGIYDGGPWSNLPDYINDKTYIDTPIEGGESWSNVRNRIQKFLNEIFDTQEPHVLVVTHEGVLKVMRSLFDNLPLDEAVKIQYDNASIYTWDMSSKFIPESVE